MDAIDSLGILFKAASDTPKRTRLTNVFSWPGTTEVNFHDKFRLFHGFSFTCSDDKET